WLAALVLVNVGAMLLVTRVPGLGIAGAALEMAGVGFYVLGFPRHTWQGSGAGGKVALLAWCVVLIAMGGLFFERLFALGSQPMPAMRFFTLAWRHLWLAGAE